MYFVAIAGGSGSGKTTFARKVLQNIPESQALIIHMDSYYLPELPELCFTDSGAGNYDHPQAFDWILLRQHLNDLSQGHSIELPVYDFASGSRLARKEILSPKKIIILEGIFSLFDQEIRKLLNISCFLHVDADIRFTRRLHRDVQERGRDLNSVIAQYYQTVRPMYMKYLEPQKQFADFIVGEETCIAAEILAARLKELIIN